MKFKKTIALSLTALICAGALAGCGSSGGSSDDAIKVMLSGTKPVGFDDVVQKYYEMAGEDAVQLDVEWVSPGDMKDKLNMRLTAGEDYDLVFDAPFLKLRNFAADGIYAPLEDYINSGEYPNLQAAYDADVYKANYYYGHLYALPNMRTYGNGIDCVYYRQDLADKYNIGQIDSMEKYQQYLDAILANEPNMVPLSVTASRGFYSLFRGDDVELAKDHIVKVNSSGFAYILLNEDNTQVVDIVYEGEPVENFSSFPEEYRDAQALGRERLQKHAEWNKYLEQDSLNQKDSASQFKGGKAASMIDNLDSYEQTEIDLTSAIPEAELGTFIINDKVRNMEKEARLTDLKGNNFLAIPATSTKIDKTLKFLDWLAASQENHDLFELGIEGVHWTAVGDDKYEVIDLTSSSSTGETSTEGTTEDTSSSANATVYNFPGYVMTWNPRYVRFSVDLNDTILEYKKYDLQKDAYYVSPIAGFTFDTSNIQTESTKVSAVISETSTALEHGIYDDPIQVLEETYAKAMDNGLQVIKDEMERQINEFLASK